MGSRQSLYFRGTSYCQSGGLVQYLPAKSDRIQLESINFLIQRENLAPESKHSDINDTNLLVRYETEQLMMTAIASHPLQYLKFGKVYRKENLLNGLYLIGHSTRDTLRHLELTGEHHSKAYTPSEADLCRLLVSECPFTGLHHLGLHCFQNLTTEIVVDMVRAPHLQMLSLKTLQIRDCKAVDAAMVAETDTDVQCDIDAGISEEW